MPCVKSVIYIALFKLPEVHTPFRSLSTNSFNSAPSLPKTHYLVVRKILLYLYHLRFSILQASPLYRLPSILLLLIPLARQDRTRALLPCNLSRVVGQKKQQLLKLPA